MGGCVHCRSVISLVKVAHIRVSRRTTVTYIYSRFATDEALKEIHRVLAPNAVFGMIWNIEECKRRPPCSWQSIFWSNTSHRQQT